MKLPIFVKGNNNDKYQDDLNQTLDGSLSDNGWTFPRLTTAQITAIAPQMPNGTTWYDTDTHELKYIKNGVVTPI